MSSQPLQAKPRAGVTVAAIPHEVFGGPDTEVVEKVLLVLAKLSGSNRLYLDFARVKAVTARGLGNLLALNKRLKAVGGRLTIAGVRPEVGQIFRVTGLSRVLHIRRKDCRGHHAKGLLCAAE